MANGPVTPRDWDGIEATLRDGRYRGAPPNGVFALEVSLDGSVTAFVWGDVVGGGRRVISFCLIGTDTIFG